MQNKSEDIKYLGCDEQKILNANPKLNIKNFKHLCRFIYDRYMVHLKKDVQKLPPHWTKNKIIQKYRFTNVRREHDKETKWLIKNVCTNTILSEENKLANIMLFRFINKSDICKYFIPIDFCNFDFEKLQKIVDNLEDKKFTNAYHTSGLKFFVNRVFNKKYDLIFEMILYVKYIHSTSKLKDFLNARNAKVAYEELTKIGGIGSFLAYQIFVDWTYCPESLWSENEFVVAGPGCKRGLDLIFEEKDNMTYEESIFWLRDNWENLCATYNIAWNWSAFTDLDQEERVMNVMSLENCMCEISKYVKVYNNAGHPRNKYKYKKEIVYDEDYTLPQIKDVLTLADNYAKKHSTCKKTAVGCYIVSEDDWRTVIGKGANAGKINCKEVGCLREELYGNNSKEHRADCRCTHSEINALNSVTKKEKLKGATVFVTRYPCYNCAKALVASGIKKVIYGRGFEIEEKTKKLFKRNNIKVRWIKSFDCDNMDMNN